MIDVSIIITCRTDPWIRWTVENVQRTCHPEEIIVVYDGLQRIEPIDGCKQVVAPWITPQGVGQCRHLGATLAGSGYLVFLDSHMDFEDNWLVTLFRTCKKDPKTIACSKSRKIIPPHGMKRPNKMLAGAVIKEVGTGTGRPLEVEWCENPAESGEIQCCLGACYCIKRSHYFKGLGEPWRYAFGWGTSEQTICMINSLCGGQNVLAECESGHYYMDNDKRGFKPDADFKVGATYNRLRLIRMVYHDNNAEMQRMVNLEAQRSKFRPYATKALNMLTSVEDSSIIDRFTVTLDEYREKWWKKTEEESKMRARPAPQPRTNDIDERFI